MMHRTSEEPSRTFYIDKLMPCCRKHISFYEGPSGGLSMNVMCTHCHHKWNICTASRFIEDIGQARDSEIPKKERKL